MRHPLILFGLIVLLTGPARAGGRDYGQARAVVARVCDGDTVLVDIPEFPDVIGKSIRIRLAGYNAEELNDPDPGRRRTARLAKQALAALLPPGTEVTLRNIRRDKYFRLDADIGLDGLDGRDVAERLRQAEAGGFPP
jgi:endonuclease YncB( thermonuclease family)